MILHWAGSNIWHTHPNNLSLWNLAANQTRKPRMTWHYHAMQLLLVWWRKKPTGYTGTIMEGWQEKDMKLTQRRHIEMECKNKRSFEVPSQFSFKNLGKLVKGEGGKRQVRNKEWQKGKEAKGNTNNLFFGWCFLSMFFSRQVNKPIEMDDMDGSKLQICNK